MFDNSRPVDLDRAKNKAPGVKTKAPFAWKTCTVTELIQFRDEITQALPPLSLKEVDLEEELLLQLHAVRALQNEVIGDDAIPPNQRAQVANSVASVLSKLMDMQEKVHTMERFKVIEALMIKHLQKLPEDAAEEFLRDYRLALEALE